MGTCFKCGASIKNIVEIDSKMYGTSCAETILGIKLPKNFKGDAEKYKSDQEIKRADNKRRFEKTILITKEGWNINEYFTSLYKKASSRWEKDFVRSCSEQCSATILEYIKGDRSFDKSLSEWNEDYMGSFPYRDYDINIEFSKLSEKQRAILNKMN